MRRERRQREGKSNVSRFRAKARITNKPLLLAALALTACGTPTSQEATHDPLGPNAACYVCHMTFVREELSQVHARANVGCIRCHGLSAGHANDENIGATPPDIAFDRPGINPACRKCHPAHNAPPETVLARWRERRAARLAAEVHPEKAVCTDCHGTHTIARPAEE